MLAELCERVLRQHASSADLVGLDIADLDYCGWWTCDGVEPITRHIPLKLSERSFLSRCSNLYSFVGERLSERHLRRLLEALGIPPLFIKDFRSLKLLEHLLQLAKMSNNTGLDLGALDGVLHERVVIERPQSVLARLFALNDLRQLDSHRVDTSREHKLREALKRFGMEPGAYRGGWGIALDAVYDGMGETLEEAITVMSRALRAKP